MGLVYLKTGKAQYAEHHFRRAAAMNPTNAVLLCCIGMVRSHGGLD
jgi:anaphase-promoting complex subunit 3